MSTTHDDDTVVVSNATNVERDDIVQAGLLDALLDEDVVVFVRWMTIVERDNVTVDWDDLRNWSTNQAQNEMLDAVGR